MCSPGGGGTNGQLGNGESVDRNVPKIIESLSVDGSTGQQIESSKVDPSAEKNWVSPSEKGKREELEWQGCGRHSRVLCHGWQANAWKKKDYKWKKRRWSHFLNQEPEKYSILLCVIYLRKIRRFTNCREQ